MMVLLGKSKYRFLNGAAAAMFVALAGLSHSADAAQIAASLPDYDCAKIDGAPQRLMSQVIDGTAYVWREYLARGANGAADPIAAPICLVRVKPFPATLSQHEAEALITRGLGVGLAAAPFAAPPSDAPPVDVLAMPLQRTDHSQGQTQSVPTPLKSDEGVFKKLSPRSSQLNLGTDQSANAMGGNAVAATIANDSRQPVADTTVFPFNTVVYLVSRFANSSARCSGVLVSPYVVMTAGHCVHDASNGGFAQNVTVTPGQYSLGAVLMRPYGTITADSVATSLAWPSFSGVKSQSVYNYKHDLATVRLATPAQFTSTFMPIAYDDPSVTAISAGYPAKDLTGANIFNQWTASGSQSADSTKYNYRRVGLSEYAIAVSPGNSGGPYWRQDSLGRRMLIGITSYGDDATGTSGGPYYGAFNMSLVSAWAGWSPSTPVADPVVASNTLFAKALTLTGESGQATGSNAGAVIEAGAPKPDGSGGRRIAWWRWTAPRTGYVTADTLGSNYDTVLGIYTGTALSNLVAIASNDDIDPGIVQQSRLGFLANAGTTYSIAVDGFDADQGAIVLNWSMAPALYPDTGWYYVAQANGGSGFGLEPSPDPASRAIYFTSFIYDDPGNPVWQSAVLTPDSTQTQADGQPFVYSGTLKSSSALNGVVNASKLGKLILQVPQKPAVGSIATAATASPVPLQLIWPAEVGGKTLALSRYPIDGKTVTLPLAGIMPQNGFWSANKADAGGLLFECQTAMCFVSYFGYRANGTPAWYVSGGQIMPDGAGYDGNLQEVSGGPTFTTPGGRLGSIDRGRISLRFSSQSSGSLTLGTNPAIPITRTTGY